MREARAFLRFLVCFPVYVGIVVVGLSCVFVSGTVRQRYHDRRRRRRADRANLQRLGLWPER